MSFNDLIISASNFEPIPVQLSQKTASKIPYLY